MSSKELRETIEAIARAPEAMSRDTVLFFEALDNIEEIKRDFCKLIEAENDAKII